MDEVGGALIAIALVLSAVFIPSAFIPGISGQFYRQFALTIATATLISLLRLADAVARRSARCCSSRMSEHPTARLGADAAARRVLPRVQPPASTGCPRGYGGLTRAAGAHGGARCWWSMPGSSALTGLRSSRARRPGFIPGQDQGYLITVISCRRAPRWRAPTRWCARVANIMLKTPGVAHAVPFAGLDGATFTNAPNAGP